MFVHVKIVCLKTSVSPPTASSDAGSWTPHDDDGGEEDIPDTPESLPPYPSNGETLYHHV